MIRGFQPGISTILLAGRTPEYDVTLQGGRVGFTSFGAGVMVVDPFTGEFRESNQVSLQVPLFCGLVGLVAGTVSAPAPAQELLK